MSQSKFLKLNKDILLEWVYDKDNQQFDDYYVLDNSLDGSRSYLNKGVATDTLNVVDNTFFTIDPVLNKYARVNTNTYNFLNLESYKGYNIEYDTIKIHFPVEYDFNEFYGFLLNVYVYDDNNTNTYDICNFIFDKDDIKLMEYNLIPFFYNDKQWQKNITIKIPSIDSISKERRFTNTDSDGIQPGTNPTPDTINYNLTSFVGADPNEIYGINQQHPTFVNFSFITKTETIFDTTYYYGGDKFETSVSKTAEYSKLSVSIKESEIGDMFEIYSLYDGERSLFQNFINDRMLLGKRYSIEYVIRKYEENILNDTQTYLLSDDLSKIIYHRPIIIFSNTTAVLEVEMRLKDEIDDSVIIRKATLGMTKNVNKYGLRLTTIEVNNILKPKIYNIKSGLGSNNRISIGSNNSSTSATQQSVFDNFSASNVIKVNYPVLHENMFVMVKGVNSTNNKYKSSGLLEILISPFTTTFKFNIANGFKNNNNIEPMNLTNLLYNSKLVMTFKSDEYIINKEIFYDSNDNDFDNGIVVFQLNETDAETIKNISKNNNNFYLTVDGEFSESKSLLYSGRFYMYDDVDFLKQKELNENSETGTYINDISSTTKDTVDFRNSNTNSTSSTVTKGTGKSITSNLKNLLIYIDPVYQFDFEDALYNVISKATQLHTAYNSAYLVIGVSEKTITEVGKIKNIDKLVIFK